MLRGTAAGIEFVFAGSDFDADWSEIAARLAERPEFYRGSRGTIVFESAPPGDALGRVLEAVERHGILLRGVYGGEDVAALAQRYEVAYLGVPPRSGVASFERKRVARAEKTAELTEKARSLQADFAGARADIATRRARGEPSVPKPVVAANPKPDAAALRPPPPPAGPSTLYHRGTLRGGQSLQQVGSIVVVGDVNPGAEVVATGDILIWGALRGTAHAGAQGDAGARVLALELVPTQLRIATYIATGDGARRSPGPEVAFVDGDRIAIAAQAKGGSR